MEEKEKVHGFIWLDMIETSHYRGVENVGTHAP
jgi:hypothetical protein